MDAGVAERAGWHSGYCLMGCTTARHAGKCCRHIGRRPQQPISCAEMRQDLDSGAECRKQKTAVCYWALGSGKREGWFFLPAAFSAHGANAVQTLCLGAAQ